jgi:hypothetical protein
VGSDLKKGLHSECSAPAGEMAEGLRPYLSLFLPTAARRLETHEPDAENEGHRYVTLANDVRRHRVLFVAEGRQQSSLEGFWGTLSEAVDQVRRREHRTLKAAGDDRLAGTCYDWLRNPAKMEWKDRREFATLRRAG